MNKKLKDILKFLMSVALAALLLYFSFRKVKWSDFAAGLQYCNWWYVVLSMLSCALAFVFRTFRWKKILKPIDPTVRFMTAYNGTNIGNLANYVIPYLGELVRCGVVTKHSPKEEDSQKHVASFDKVIGTAIVERFWDVSCFLLIIVVLLCFTWDRFGAFFVEKVWSPIVSTGHKGLIITAALVILSSLTWVVIKYRDKVKFFGKVYYAIVGVFTGIKKSFFIRGKFIFAFQSLLIWAMYWLMIVFVARALPEFSSLTVIDTLFISMIGSFASIVPVPGGMGAYHYIVALTLSTIYGFGWEISIVFATLAHESQTVTMIITGIFSYIWESAAKE